MSKKDPLTDKRLVKMLRDVVAEVAKVTNESEEHVLNHVIDAIKAFLENIVSACSSENKSEVLMVNMPKVLHAEHAKELVSRGKVVIAGEPFHKDENDEEPAGFILHTIGRYMRDKPELLTICPMDRVAEMSKMLARVDTENGQEGDTYDSDFGMFFRLSSSSGLSERTLKMAMRKAVDVAGHEVGVLFLKPIMPEVGAKAN